MRIGAGQEDVLVEERAAGQMVGWSGLIPPHRFTLKASAQIDTDVLRLPRTPLLEFFDRNPAVGYVVMRNLASVVGQRLQVFQAMWLREMQRFVETRSS
jgi:CRP-like cAMP-binding protein